MNRTTKATVEARSSQRFLTSYSFLGSSQHRDLHSFPTRRSSDLGYTGPDSFTFTANDGSLDSNTATVSLTVADNQRSEEHTSELQSHVNLVCRLLLEKKNGNLMNIHPLYSYQVERYCLNGNEIAL